MNKLQFQVQIPAQMRSHTTEPPSSHPVLVVLQLLKNNFLEGRPPQTAEDLWEQFKRIVHGASGAELDSILKDLHALALVQCTKSTVRQHTVEHWAPAPGWASELKGDGGGHDAIATDDPSGPRRFPEVLAHPILFALPQEDFHDMVDRMLEG